MTHSARFPRLLEAGAWHVLARLGVLLVAGMLVDAAWSGRWQLSFGLSVFLLASLGILRLRKLLPGAFLFLLMMAAVFNGAGGSFGWFDDTAWFDEWAHLYTGFAGLAAVGFIHAQGQATLGRTRMVAWCTLVGLALGIGWELVEGLLGDLEFIDTVSDVVLDTVGSALGGLFAWHALRALPPDAGPAPAVRKSALR